MIFDGLLFNNKPDLNLNRIPHINENTIFTNNQLDEVKLRDRIRNASNDLYLIDVESPNYRDEIWNGTGYDINQQTNLDISIDLYKRISEVIRDERPGFRFGFYDVLPQFKYWRRSFIWKARNDYFKDLSKYVDVVFPSLYTYYQNQQGWIDVALDNINEAKKYSRPIYVYLWPMYHDSTQFKNQFIEPDFWRLQLETCLTHADGIVLWGGSGIEWDELSPWWQITKEYI